MKSTNRIARIVGVLFIIGTVSGGLSVAFTSNIFGSADPLTAVADNQANLTLGAIFVLTMAIALVMVPVVLYPIFKQYNEALALGAVVFRGVLEAVTYMGIVICWLLLITLSWENTQADAPDFATYQTLGTLIAGAEQWLSILLAIVFSMGALMIYYLFYQSRLIPRWLSIWGLVGGLLYLVSPFIAMFNPQTMSLSLNSEVGYLMIPLAIQEMVMAVWLIVKGFSSPAAEPTSTIQLITSSSSKVH